MTFAQLIRIFMAITMATQGAGQAMSRAPSAMRAQRAMRSVFHLIDLKVGAGSSDTASLAHAVSPSTAHYRLFEHRRKGPV